MSGGPELPQASELSVSDLTVAYEGAGTQNIAVRNVDLVVTPGQIAALAGESGSGKSTLALAAIGYNAPGARVLGGSVRLGDLELQSLSSTQRRKLWGKDMGFVAQSAVDALNPALRIGDQLSEVIQIHEQVDTAALKTRRRELLERVGIPDPEAALRRYPHEFSGGQLQRIAIAAAIACHPRILILDEPTTGLDVRTQSQISALIGGLVKEQGIGALYVSHDLALLSEVSDRIYVMYGGEIIEAGPTGEVLARPSHPYTRALLDAAPSVAVPRRLIGIPGRPPARLSDSGCAFAPRCRFATDSCRSERIELSPVSAGVVSRCRRTAELELAPTVEPLAQVSTAAEINDAVLAVNEVSLRYQKGGRDAVSEVSLTVKRGEAVGLVGESGSGKSTLLRVIAGLLAPSQGTVELHGQALAGRVERRSRDAKQAVQLIFQNPDSSLNNSQTVAEIIGRPLQLFRGMRSSSERQAAVEELLDKVDLDTALAERHPDELSGGQKQRVAIARAFAAGPELLLCDEITSALDVSAQATVVTMLSELAQAEGVAVLFVTHDLAVVRAVASRIVVMKSGQVVETGDAQRLFDAPQADYTRDLLAAIPTVPTDSDTEVRAHA